MKKSVTVTANEQKLLSFARSYLAESFPNPERIGCPSSQSLQALAERPTQADLSVTEHLSCCSPCFREYQELLAGLNRAKRPVHPSRSIFHFTDISIYVGAGLALFTAVVLCVLLWRSHRQPVVANVVETGRLAVQNIEEARNDPYTPFVLDLRASSRARGLRESAHAPVHVPRSRLDISVYLPMGSDAGRYRVSLTERRRDTWSTVMNAQIKDGITVGEFKVDFSRLAPGEYFINLSASDGSELSQALIVEDQNGRH